jgi:hypothetical protein
MQVINVWMIELNRWMYEMDCERKQMENPGTAVKTFFAVNEGVGRTVYCS